MINDAVVKVFTTEVGVTVGWFDFKHAIAQFQHWHVERTTTKVEDHDLFVFFTLEAVG